MDLETVEYADCLQRILAWETKLTTGTSNSYRSRQALDPGLMTSISLKANGRWSQTSDSTDLACVHSPQFSRVKKVILQDCKSRELTRMVGEAKCQQNQQNGIFGGLMKACQGDVKHLASLLRERPFPTRLSRSSWDCPSSGTPPPPFGWEASIFFESFHTPSFSRVSLFPLRNLLLPFSPSHQYLGADSRKSVNNSPLSERQINQRTPAPITHHGAEVCPPRLRQDLHRCGRGLPLPPRSACLPRGTERYAFQVLQPSPGWLKRHAAARRCDCRVWRPVRHQFRLLLNAKLTTASRTQGGSAVSRVSSPSKSS